MIVSQEVKNTIEKRFEQVKISAKNRADKLFYVLDNCTEDEAICLKYLYAFMSEQDLANCDGSIFLKFVKHALKLKTIMPWGNYLEGELFLNYVLQYRMNNENVEFYAEELYNEIAPIIKGKSMHDAVIAVNYWCFSKATYQATDGRTASPLTVIRNAYGRCGEESTFNVAALRSVGIPARQVYSPRWAHCDDNHAWTEAWIENEWHFLGACEPEAVLDSGWFMLPASKGMLINTRISSTITKDEEVVLSTDTQTEINSLKRYADTKRIKIKINDTKGNPLNGVKVRFEVVNYSEFFPLTSLETNADGEVLFLTGLGDLLVYAHKDDVSVYEKIDVRESDSLVMTMPDSFVKEPDVEIIRLVPPKGKSPNDNPLSYEVKALHEKRNAESLAIRKAFEETFFIGEKAENWAKDFAPYESQIKEALERARGNYTEIQNFITDKDTLDLLKQKVDLFSTLNKKDFSDITCEILKSHLVDAVKYKDNFDEEIFVKNLLAPRILLEMITPYRQTLFDMINEETKKMFIENPTTVYTYINEHIETKPLTNSAHFSSPVGLFELGYGRLMSKKILFVAICRSLGVPARFNREDGSIGFYKDNKWTWLKDNKKEIQKDSKLTLLKENDELEYYKSYTVSKLVKGVYMTLNFENDEWKDNQITYMVEDGRYRVVVTDRNSEGSLTAKVFYTDVLKNAEVKLKIDIERCMSDTVRSVDIKDLTIKTIDDKQLSISEATHKTKSIVGYLDVGAEPTEHLLNEFLQSKDKFNNVNPNIILVVKNKNDIENRTLAKVLKELPNIKVYAEYEKDELNHIYEGFEIEDKKLPLTYIMNEPMKAQNAWAGYNVGIGDMLLKYLVK